MMWKFKSCPKCGGDLFIDWDLDGWYVQCLQCGYIYEQTDTPKAKIETDPKVRKLAKTGAGKPHAK